MQRVAPGRARHVTTGNTLLSPPACHTVGKRRRGTPAPAQQAARDNYTYIGPSIPASALCRCRDFFINGGTKKMTNPGARMMTIRQLAAEGVMAEHALRQLVRQNRLPAVRVGNRYLMDYYTVCRLLASGLPDDSET